MQILKYTSLLAFMGFYGGECKTCLFLATFQDCCGCWFYHCFIITLCYYHSIIRQLLIAFLFYCSMYVLLDF